MFLNVMKFDIKEILMSKDLKSRDRVRDLKLF